MKLKNLTEYLHNYSPFGGGVRYNDVLNDKGIELSLKAVGSFFNGLSRLISDMVSIHEMDCSLPLEPIGELFNQHGSDKSSTHRYDLIYQPIFDDIGKESSCNICEIGLGTNNIDIPSHMGRNGKPGASLFAYRDYFTNANIFGADIDKRILFNDIRIKTTYVDQLEPDTFTQMHLDLGSPILDIFIEDGLHSVSSSLHSLNYALNHVRKGGYIILEDLVNRDQIWQTIATIIKLSREFESIDLINSGGLVLKIKT